jgi:hypothetical protein
MRRAPALGHRHFHELVQECVHVRVSHHASPPLGVCTRPLRRHATVCPSRAPVFIALAARGCRLSRHRAGPARPRRKDDHVPFPCSNEEIAVRTRTGTSVARPAR